VQLLRPEDSNTENAELAEMTRPGGLSDLHVEVFLVEACVQHRDSVNFGSAEDTVSLKSLCGPRRNLGGPLRLSVLTYPWNQSLTQPGRNKT
jgi:hypothetical protein